VLHARPGERFDLWFGILVAQLMLTLAVSRCWATSAPGSGPPSRHGCCKEPPGWSS
jgi:hypothetical protein